MTGGSSILAKIVSYDLSPTLIFLVDIDYSFKLM